MAKRGEGWTGSGWPAGVAAIAWIAACASLFVKDAGLGARAPSALLQWALVAFALVALAAALRAHRDAWSTGLERCALGALFVAFLCVAFRLPLALSGAAGYLTPDGSLSGIVALHARDGTAHHVFVPSVPYSGSLKSHMTAILSLAIDPARAFALVSLVFYGGFGAAVYVLARLADERRPQRALVAGLWAVFAPAFVTRYSLSNDGNYVEVLALGTAALALSALWAREERHGDARSALIGLLLGLAWWCHLLAIIPTAVVGAFFLVARGSKALRSLAIAFFGWALGYAPGLLWNLGHGFESFAYLVPGGQSVGALERGPGWMTRLLGVFTDGLPTLVGHDRGYPPVWDLSLRIVSVLGLLALGGAYIDAVRQSLRSRRSVDALLALAVVVNVVIASAALPFLPGNPRYLLLLFAPAAVLLGRVAAGTGRLAAAGLLVVGLAGSLGQVPAALAADRQWRSFIAEMKRAHVSACETDFFLAPKITFLSQGEIVCSSRLGPNTTEYFEEHARIVGEAHDVAIVAVNKTAADRIERRLNALGVAHSRVDSMKPFFASLSRRVQPSELFPGRVQQR